jgi:hypothetical protein
LCKKNNKLKMAMGDINKWNMPGWRIEQKFSPGVLIGNWGEDRYTVS